MAPRDSTCPASRKWKNEAGAIFRFLIVGAFNTLIGYVIILLAFAAGAGDYLANLVGFALGWPIAYFFHRRWTFRRTTRPSPIEALRYVLCMGMAYGVNLGVITLGRSAGYINNPIVQLAAIGAYAAIFYLLSRLIVFRGNEQLSQARRS
ncbi:MAG: GtrA family protein [Sphingomonadaceae bacterium]